MEETTDRLERRSPLGLILFRILFHGAAVVFVAMLLAAPLMSPATLESLWLARQWSGLPYLMGRELLIHFGVSLSLWAALYLLWLALKQGGVGALHGLRRARKRPSGSVFVETLIVLPVLLTLISGLAQLSVINVAGILTNLAAVNAGRTVWIWLPETRPIGGTAPRGGVNRERVAELARIQAAMAVVPVAPSDMRIDPEVGSDLAKLMRGSLVANQLEYLPNDAGRAGVLEASRLGDGRGENAGDDLSFARALDGSSFLVRTARKFSAAYIATRVDILERGDWVGARVTYKQHAAFPFTTHLFGNVEVVGQRKGVYVTIVREFDLKTQVEPNARFPRRIR